MLFCMMMTALLFLGHTSTWSVEYIGRSLGDPFGSEATAPPPPDSSASAESSITVEGLVWGSKLPQAIINGQVVTVGGRVGDWEVVRIDKTGVTLRSGEKEIHLGVKRKDKNEKQTAHP